jgi:hypothetical protein
LHAANRSAAPWADGCKRRLDTLEIEGTDFAAPTVIDDSITTLRGVAATDRQR